MKKEWKILPAISDSLKDIYTGHSPYFAKLLFNRGLVRLEEIEEFLNPDYGRLKNPFLFRDMEKAVLRIEQALAKKEKICIFGDYDADAVTAAAVLIRTFQNLGHSEIFYYIPDRFTEGYGVSIEALEKICKQGACLIITVDCGINSVQEAEWLKSKGVDLIITDHHELLGREPEAVSVIDPKNPSDRYPFSELTGVGVAFKLACGVLEYLRKKNIAEATGALLPGWEKWLLDLVAIGTVADCHALVDENRILVKYGLMVLTKSRWPGLKAVCRMAGLDFALKVPDTYTLGFVVAPRLNAAGRLEHAGQALEVLLEDNFSEAEKKAAKLEEINTRRQQITGQIVSEAREMAEKVKDRKILALMGEGWPKGIVGLVAGKISEEFGRPTIVLTKDGDQAVGSARSAGSVDILSSLKHADSFLVRYGGHKQAAGLTLQPENFENFYRSLLDFAGQYIEEKDLVPSLVLEDVLETEHFSEDFYKQMETLKPFGAGNEQPVFMLSGATIKNTRLVGLKKNHLQLVLEYRNKLVKAIAFNMGFWAEKLETGLKIDAACQLLLEEWQGEREIKLKVEEIKISIYA